MNQSSDIQSLQVNFSQFNLEQHVKKALRTAIGLADGQSIDARLALEGILMQSSQSKTAAFKKIAELIPNFTGGRLKTAEPSSDLKSVELEFELHNSYKRCERFFRESKNVWGRDLVTMVILTKNDPGLAAFVKESNLTLEVLQDKWFEFVSTTKGPRTPETWIAWWEAAGIPIPSKRPAPATLHSKDNDTKSGKHEPQQAHDNEEKSPDVFILYNRREQDIVKPINEALRLWDINTYFWESDIRFGATWIEKEARFLQEAKLILVFLGKHGWGPTHEKLAIDSVRLERSIIPVLIGTPPSDQLLKVNSMFKELRYIDLTSVNPSTLNELRQAIISRQKDGPTLDTNDFDALIRTLMDGNEAEREDVLEQIMISDNYNRKQLSARLREELLKRFSPEVEKNVSSSPRSLQTIPSIRSWMISSLIYCDAKEPANRDLLLKHLSPDFEPNENVRYWALAGLYQRQKDITYMDEALGAALSGSPTVVTLLARAVQSPSDPKLLEEFRRLLLSSNFQDCWGVLRVLRIVPIPTLAETVCQVLRSKSDSEPLVYDAFYALASATMATEAATHLSHDPGPDKIVVRLIHVLSDANLNGRRKLSRILLAFDQSQITKALDESMRDPDRRIIARQVRRILEDANRERNNIGDVNPPGFTSDFIDVHDDSLNIEQDVKTLTAVILSKNVKLPLAIGLFGDWGHGKSFFIQSIKDEINSAKGKYNGDTFYTEVAQIEFNAWHYVDTSLWASLVSHILSELSNYISPPKTYEEKKQAFLQELKSTQDIVDETTAQKEVVKSKISEKQKRLQKLQLEREEKEIQLREMRPEDIFSILPEPQKEELKKLLNKLGIPSAVKSISDLENVSKEMLTTAGRAQSLFFSLFQSKNAFIIIGLLVLILFLIPWGFTWISQNTVIDEFTKNIASAVTKIGSVVGGLILTLRNGLTTLNSGMTKIEEIKVAAEKKLLEKRMTPSDAEIALQTEINKLTAEEKETELVISSAAQRMAELEERIRLLNEERSLNRFLTERTQSDDYRKHLGIISTIRQDFNALTERLTDASRSISGFNPVDRIILYIDDLDRCPVDKVMQVLQAVHLLLAFPLFVVIVGVDPRWLLHSLSASFTAFQNEGTNFSTDKRTAEAWLTTPQNFLEKIFQIQFCLKPMSSDGYATLIGKLLRNDDGQRKETKFDSKTTADHNTESTNGKQNATAGSGVKGNNGLDPEKNIATATRVSERDVSAQAAGVSEKNSEKEEESNKEKADLPQSQKKTDSNSEDMTSEQEGKKNETQKTRKGKFTVNEESLVIRDWEIEFAEHLFELIPSPRAAGRFSNVYRLLKASVLKKDLPAFEGRRELSGDFQVPMLLLALLIGASREAVRFFPDIEGQIRKGSSIRVSLANIRASVREKDSYGSVIEKIQHVVNQKDFPSDSRLILEWIPKVARFSFDLSRALKPKEF